MNNIFSQPSESLLSFGDGAPSAPSSLSLVQRVGTNFPEGTKPVSVDQHGIYFRVPGFEELQYYTMDQLVFIGYMNNSLSPSPTPAVARVSPTANSPNNVQAVYRAFSSAADFRSNNITSTQPSIVDDLSSTYVPNIGGVPLETIKLSFGDDVDWFGGNGKLLTADNASITVGKVRPSLIKAIHKMVFLEGTLGMGSKKKSTSSKLYSFHTLCAGCLLEGLLCKIGTKWGTMATACGCRAYKNIRDFNNEHIQKCPNIKRHFPSFHSPLDNIKKEGRYPEGKASAAVAELIMNFTGTKCSCCKDSNTKLPEEEK